MATHYSPFRPAASPKLDIYLNRLLRSLRDVGYWASLAANEAPLARERARMAGIAARVDQRIRDLMLRQGAGR